MPRHDKRDRHHQHQHPQSHEARANKHAGGGDIRVHDEDDLAGLLEGQENPLVLVLDCVQDPHNLGACLRTADAAVQTAWQESMTQSLSRLSAEERRAAITAFIKEWTGPMGRRGRREGRRDREERLAPADERR